MGWGCCQSCWLQLWFDNVQCLSPTPLPSEERGNMPVALKEAGSPPQSPRALYLLWSTGRETISYSAWLKHNPQYKTTLGQH